MPDESEPREPTRKRLAVLTVLFFALACLCVGDYPGVTIASSYDGRYAPRRFGLYAGQVCYSTRTVAGATPPRIEQVVWPIWPVFVRHAMASNLAGYTIVAVPLWPLLVVIGWPVGRYLLGEWLRRAQVRVNAPRRGFEPILLAERSPPASSPAAAGEGTGREGAAPAPLGAVLPLAPSPAAAGEGWGEGLRPSNGPGKPEDPYPLPR